ncbi:MAG: prenyltransferase [Myxococcales bacterium]|nr:prenyltransferase [Myxococcales bacterium]
MCRALDSWRPQRAGDAVGGISRSMAVAWLRASRLAAQSYIAPPLLLGQLWALFLGADFDGAICGWLMLFGLFDQLFIVYSNDYADRGADALNRTPTLFSGGSRVLVEAVLTPRALGRAAAATALLTFSTGAVLAFGFGRPLSLPLGVLALLLMWAYSFPPLSLSYRGGGELLQALGVGFCLPLFGFYNQAGTLEGLPWALLVALLPTHLACAAATSLPDADGDRAAGKHSASVVLGRDGARRAIWVLHALTIASMAVLPAEALAPSLALLGLPALATVGFALGALGSAGSPRLTVQVGLAVAATLLTVLVAIAAVLP